MGVPIRAGALLLVVACSPLYKPARGSAEGPAIVLDMGRPMQAHVVRVCPETDFDEFFATLEIKAAVREEDDPGAVTPRVGISVTGSEEWDEGPVPSKGALKLSVGGALMSTVEPEDPEEEPFPLPCEEGVQVLFERLDPALTGSVRIEWTAHAAVTVRGENRDLDGETIHVHVDP